jgi:hypothetical protein
LGCREGGGWISGSSKKLPVSNENAEGTGDLLLVGVGLAPSAPSATATATARGVDSKVGGTAAAAARGDDVGIGGVDDGEEA